MGQNYNTPNSGTGAQVDDDLCENTDTLRSSFSGTSFPGSPVDGQVCYRTDLDAYYYYNGTTWVEQGSALKGDLDLQGDGTTFRQLLNARLENASADPTPSADELGRAVLKTTSGAEKVKVVTTAAKLETVWSAGNTDYQRVELPTGAWERDATNPPTPVGGTAGTTPTIRGLLFDNVNELMSACKRIPAGYSEDADLVLRVFDMLKDAGEVNGNDVEWTLDVVAELLNTAGVLVKTSTQYTGFRDIGAFTSIHSIGYVDIVIDFDDATNPIEQGSMICMELRRTSVGGAGKCAGVAFLGAQLLVPSGHKPTE